MESVIVDVRELDEFNAESIESSVHIPLSHFDSMAPGILTRLMDHKVIFMCRSGARAKLALERAKQLGFQPSGGYEIYPEGILGWKKQGHSTVAKKSRHLPILRQTHLAAGALGLIGVALGHFVDSRFYGIAAFVLCGLTFSGLSGLCLMSKLLAIAPWNKSRQI